MTQECGRSRVRPVEIVEHQHRRRPLRYGEQGLGDGVDEPCALLVGLQRHRLREVRPAFLERRYHPCERRSPRPEIAPQGLLVGLARILRQRLRERPVRPRRFTLVAAPPPHQRLPHTTSASAARAVPTTSSSARVSPTPGSPPTIPPPPRPLLASSHRRSSRPSSTVRPVNGVCRSAAAGSSLS